MLSTVIHGLVWLVLVSGFLYLVVWGLDRWYGEEITILHGASLVLLEIGFWDFVLICGPSVPSLPSLPYLWHDPRILGREKRLAPLWSGP